MNKMIRNCFTLVALLTFSIQVLAAPPKKTIGESVECFLATKSAEMIDDDSNKMKYENSVFSSEKDGTTASVTFASEKFALIRIYNAEKDQHVSVSGSFSSTGEMQVTSHSMLIELLCRKK